VRAHAGLSHAAWPVRPAALAAVVRKLRVPPTALFCAVALFLGACAPPADPAPVAPGSLDSALAATRRGDLAALRRDLGKEAGLGARARASMARLDPEAWLVAQGARWREHDLDAAWRARDDAAMRVALGFTDDALVSTLLRAPSRVSERYSDGRRYFRTVDPPLELIQDLAPKGCPAGLSACLFRYKAELSERVCVARVGFADGALTELYAGEDIGQSEELDASRPSFASPAATLNSEFSSLLPALPGPLPSSARSLELVALDGAATLYWVLLDAKDGRWQARFAIRTTQQQRLQRAQEAALQAISQAALDSFKKHGRWPTVQELGLRASDWVDWAAPSGERGWQAHAPNATAGFKLAAQAPQDAKSRVAESLDGLVWITQDGQIHR
jgi:hypothetical protein